MLEYYRRDLPIQAIPVMEAFGQMSVDDRLELLFHMSNSQSGALVEIIEEVSPSDIKHVHELPLRKDN